MFILLILINPEKSLKLKKRLFWSGFSKPFPHIPFIYTTHSKYSLRLVFGLLIIINIYWLLLVTFLFLFHICIKHTCRRPHILHHIINLVLLLNCIAELVR